MRIKQNRRVSMSVLAPLPLRGIEIPTPTLGLKRFV
jgi:hypothetical protein